MEHNDMGDRLEGAMKVLPHPFHIAVKSPTDFDHMQALLSAQHNIQSQTEGPRIWLGSEMTMLWIDRCFWIIIPETLHQLGSALRLS